MKNEIINTTRGSVGMAAPGAPDVAAIMNSALAPFKFFEQWSRSGALEAAAKFTAVDEYGDLVALGYDVDWIASRARAVEIQNQLPPLAEIAAAHKSVDQAIRVEPASGEYQLLASKMLDVLGIKGGDDTDAYVEALAMMLADVDPDINDWPDTPRWVPIPAFAKAVKRIWSDRDAWEHFGGTKRPPIPDIVERCRDYRRDLFRVRDRIELLSHTQQQLGQIIERVDSYEADDWWGDDEPSKH
jgi:hypothetical protein